MNAKPAVALLTASCLASCSWSMKSPPARTAIYSPGNGDDVPSIDSCTDSYRYPIVDAAGSVVTAVLTTVLYFDAVANDQRRISSGVQWPIIGLGIGSVVFAVSTVRGVVVARKCKDYLRSIGEID
jgi:hypothetical protein